MNAIEKIRAMIEALSKQIEIIKSKLFIHSAGIAGCWTFLSGHYEKMDFLVIITITLIVVFGIGVSKNLVKLNDTFSELLNPKYAIGNAK